MRRISSHRTAACTHKRGREALNEDGSGEGGNGKKEMRMWQTHDGRWIIRRKGTDAVDHRGKLQCGKSLIRGMASFHGEAATQGREGRESKALHV